MEPLAALRDVLMLMEAEAEVAARLIPRLDRVNELASVIRLVTELNGESDLEGLLPFEPRHRPSPG